MHEGNWPKGGWGCTFCGTGLGVFFEAYVGGLQCVEGLDLDEKEVG